MTLLFQNMAFVEAAGAVKEITLFKPCKVSVFNHNTTHFFFFDLINKNDIIRVSQELEDLEIDFYEKLKEQLCTATRYSPAE